MTEKPLITARRPIQLQLGDLLFLVLVNGIVCAVIIPFILGSYYPGDPGLPYPSVAAPRLPAYVYVVCTFSVFVGGLPMLLFGNREKWPLPARWFGAVMACLPSLALSGLVSSGVLNYLNGRHYSPEFAAESVCKAYCTAQDIYRRTDYNGDGVLEYASTATGPFGLNDPTIELMDHSFGPAVWGEGHPVVPKGGYIFKILRGAGPHVHGAHRTYMQTDAEGHERMIYGYALVAAPAVYDYSGTSTFIVSNLGSVYACDFGAKTPEVFKAMTEFDPDPEMWMFVE